MQLCHITLQQAKNRIENLIKGAHQEVPLIIVGGLDQIHELLKEHDGAKRIGVGTVATGTKFFDDNGELSKDINNMEQLMYDGSKMDAKEYLNLCVNEFKDDEAKLLYDTNYSLTPQSQGVCNYIAKNAGKPLIILTDAGETSDTLPSEILFFYR